MMHTKHLVRVTLDIMCYDDLDLEDLNWRRLLELEGDEDVDVSIQDIDLDSVMWQFDNWSYIYLQHYKKREFSPVSGAIKQEIINRDTIESKKQGRFLIRSCV